MRCLAVPGLVCGLAALATACGPSDTIDVSAPDGRSPTPARADSARPEVSDAGVDPPGSGPAGDAADPSSPPSDAAGGIPPSGADDAAGQDASALPDVPPTMDTPAEPGGPPDVAGRLDGAAPDVARALDAAPRLDSPPGADAPASPCLPAPANDEVISLFEDGALGSRQVAGRGGTMWGTINTDQGATATLSVPQMPVRCGSSRALRFAGTATTVTPILRLTLLPGSAQFYDASAYRGLRFSLRAGVPGRVRLKVSDRNTASFGGMCTVCNDHFGADLDVTTDWKSFSIAFSSLSQSGFGDQEESLDETALSGIELVVRNQPAFELFVDDISFFR